MAYANNMHGAYTSYYFGPDMVVAPVVSKVSDDTNLATTEVGGDPKKGTRSESDRGEPLRMSLAQLLTC